MEVLEIISKWDSLAAKRKADLAAQDKQKKSAQKKKVLASKKVRVRVRVKIRVRVIVRLRVIVRVRVTPPD